VIAYVTSWHRPYDTTISAAVVLGEKDMNAQRFRYSVGKFLKRYFPAPETWKSSLKQELKELREGLQAVQWGEVNSVRREIESAQICRTQTIKIWPNEAE
jgi:hypothetical protein